jgi:hypothetical protein
MVEVVSAGVVVLVPVTVPIVGLMEVVLAFVTLQLRVEVPFVATVVGEAAKEEMVGDDPPLPVCSLPTA